MFASSIAVGIVAFGWTMLMGPILLLFLPPRMVVDINLILGTVLMAVLVATAWRHIKWRTVAPMILGAGAGIPVGTWVLTSVSETTLRISFTTLVIMLVIPVLLQRFRPLPHENWAACGLGFVVGAIAAGTALGGPLLAFFAVNQGWGRDRTRANLAAFFITVGPMALAAHVVAGVFTVQTLSAVSLLVPATLIGTYLATRIVRYVNERFFRRLVLAAIIGISLTVLIQEAVRM